MTQEFNSNLTKDLKQPIYDDLKSNSNLEPTNYNPSINKSSLSHKELKDKIISKVGTDLANIEKALHENLTPHLVLVSEIAGHLLFSGGKRLRPLLMVLSAKLCSCQLNPINVELVESHTTSPLAEEQEEEEEVSSILEYDSVVKFSTIFEYLHAATLLHDDVVDEAQMRRGTASAHSRWSVPKVVLTGDFLLARSLSLAAQTENSEIIAIMAKITEEMSQGEIEQMEQKGKINLTESQYLTIIERKTAVLIQGACKSGAIIAHEAIKTKNSYKGVNKDATGNESKDSKEKANQDKKEYYYIQQKEAVERYGYHLGIAFQIADDLLDYTGDAVALGKKPGADIREGKLTLPLIHALSRANSEDRQIIENIIKKDTERFAVILEKINKYKGLEYAEMKANLHVALAKKSLEFFKPCEAKEILMLLADYAISRKV